MKPRHGVVGTRVLFGVRWVRGRVSSYGAWPWLSPESFVLIVISENGGCCACCWSHRESDCHVSFPQMMAHFSADKEVPSCPWKCTHSSLPTASVMSLITLQQHWNRGFRPLGSSPGSPDMRPHRLTSPESWVPFLGSVGPCGAGGGQKWS